MIRNSHFYATISFIILSLMTLSGCHKDEEKQTYGLYSVFAVNDNGDNGYHILETIYDLSYLAAPEKSVHVN